MCLICVSGFSVVINHIFGKCCVRNILELMKSTSSNKCWLCKKSLIVDRDFAKNVRVLIIWFFLRNEVQIIVNKWYLFPIYFSYGVDPKWLSEYHWRLSSAAAIEDIRFITCRFLHTLDVLYIRCMIQDAKSEGHIIIQYFQLTKNGGCSIFGHLLCYYLLCGSHLSPTVSPNTKKNLIIFSNAKRVGWIL